MRLRLSAFLAVLVPMAALAQAPGVPVGSSHYTLVEADNGKTVGSAEAAVATIPAGYLITSRGELKMAKFSYSFSNSNRLDSRLNIVRDQLTGTVNGAQVTFGLVSDATGRQFQISIDASGKTTTNTVDRHQHLALLPDLDPAAYIEMTHFALENPPTTWVIIPKENGVLVPAQYNPRPDVSATIQGRPTTVHHTSVVVSEQNGITVELYYTSDGRLLEADLPEQNFYVIEEGFHLQNRPQYEPPRGTAPPSSAEQPGEGGYPPQGQGQYPPPQGQYPPPQNQ
ncbi:MAG TPA: hypothetical protein VHU89_18395 [Acidobacteriaceae bacterium]|jgi:hypothetical protein|nr:hypothetical protein [Acidobacteriaceae bacterium]